MVEVYRKTIRHDDRPGQIHFLTFSCFGCQPFLTRERCCQWLADALIKGQERKLFKLWAYVFMPEHVHLILKSSDETPISRILTSIKSPIAKKAVHWVKTNSPEFLSRMEDRQPNERCCHRFWQRGPGYDRNLRSPTDIRAKIRYIHANPVRRGLVEQAEDWIWSSSRIWKTGEKGPIPIDRQGLMTSKEQG